MSSEVYYQVREKAGSVLYQPCIERTESLASAAAFTLGLKFNLSEMISTVGMIYNDIYFRIAQGLLFHCKGLINQKAKG